MSNREVDEGRRELLRLVGRGVAFVALAGGAAVLAARSRSGEACDRRHPCVACELRKDCRLPRRKAAEEVTR